MYQCITVQIVFRFRPDKSVNGVFRQTVPDYYNTYTADTGRLFVGRFKINQKLDLASRIGLLLDRGVEVRFVRDLIDNHARGIHFYTLNNANATLKIYEALGVADEELDAFRSGRS